MKAMRTIRSLVGRFALVCLLSSCQDEAPPETGLCEACCDNKGSPAHCYENFTKAECEEYNLQKVEGYTWKFLGAGAICTPAFPE